MKRDYACGYDLGMKPLLDDLVTRKRSRTARTTRPRGVPKRNRTPQA